MAHSIDRIGCGLAGLLRDPWGKRSDADPLLQSADGASVLSRAVGIRLNITRTSSEIRLVRPECLKCPRSADPQERFTPTAPAAAPLRDHGSTKPVSTRRPVFEIGPR